MCYVHVSAGAFRGQKRVLSPLELEDYEAPDMGAGNCEVRVLNCLALLGPLSRSCCYKLRKLLAVLGMKHSLLEGYLPGRREAQGSSLVLPT